MQISVPSQQEITISEFRILDDLVFQEKAQEFTTESLPRILIVAKSQGGKSWVIKELLFQLRNLIPCGIIVSPTNKENKFYSSIFPETYIYDNCSEEQIELILQYQMAQSALRELKGNFNRTFLFIMDDCAFNKKFLESESFRKILFNSRHYHIIFIFSTQCISEIPTDVRQNFSHILLLKNDSASNIQTFQKSFAANLSLQEFKELYQQSTKDFGCLAIKKNILDDQTNRYAKFFRFRSRNWKEVTTREEKEFVVGSLGFWKQHLKKYDKKKNFNEALKFIAKNAEPVQKKKAQPKETTINFLFKDEPQKQ